ncbi:MAG: MFS transporter [Chloroflexi bacterium]|nr:MFS transporter [Chloroflexota bacterium]
MLQKLRTLYNEYPRQFWLMITGIVLATAGGSMIWPFLLIYASGKLNLPLSTVATLISINAGTGLLSSFLAGTLADKIGRKVVMVFSLAMNGIAYFFLMRAETYPHFVILMILIGLSNPLYQVGADAMLADMILSEKRTDAYAINRIANNAAFAMGPAVGGFLASTSYNLAFYGAAAGFTVRRRASSLTACSCFSWHAKHWKNRQTNRTLKNAENAEKIPR